MTIEIKPMGIACNLKCDYCYQANARAFESAWMIDDATIDKLVEDLGTDFLLFGGECLLTPLPVLERLLSKGYQKYGKVAVQTNGTLMNEAHMDLFEKYNVEVGISIDGPGALNDARSAGTLEATRLMTARTEAAIENLTARGRTPGLIITLHHGNVGTDESYHTFKRWLRHLRKLGMRSVNLHVLENDHLADKWAMPIERLIYVLLDLWKFSDKVGIKFTIFSEITTLLTGTSHCTVCTWRACDPWNTTACVSYEPDGSPTSCTRPVKDGRVWLPAEPRAFERQLALAVTPQEHNGCSGCQYWSMCTGHCPGCGVDGDWRNRTMFCAAWKELFAEGERRMEARGEVPFTQHPQRAAIEARMYELWSQGVEFELSDVVNEITKGTPIPRRNSGNSPHGDHYDTALLVHQTPHGNIPHGDAPHGNHNDTHGNAEHGDVPHGDSFQAISPVDYAKSAEYRDNGFTSEIAMYEAHNIVINALLPVLGSTHGQRVLDLGCGNGMLLRRALEYRQDATFFPIGYDINERSIARAWQAYPQGRWKVGDITQVDWTTHQADVVVLFPGRLLEVSGEVRETFKRRIEAIPHVVLYCYSDSMNEGLSALCQQLGWEVEITTHGPSAEAGIMIRGERV